MKTSRGLPAGHLYLLLRHALAMSVLVVVLPLASCSSLFPYHIVRYLEYPAQKGDTIESIGQRFSVSAREIARANYLNVASALTPGQIIKVPLHGHVSQNGRRSHELAEDRTRSRAKPLYEVSSATMKTIRLSSAKHYVGHLSWPLSNGEMSSPFGRRWFSFHEGIDIAAPEGTKIHAAHRGQVVYSGDGLRGYGNLIVISGDGLLTVYAHNHANAVRVGQHVEQGEILGTVGQSGKATGPHLHFETRIKDSTGKNVAVDPLAFFVPSR